MSNKLINEFIIECIRITEFYQIHNLREASESVIRKAESVIIGLDMAAEVSEYLTKLINGSDESGNKEYSSLCNRRNTK